MFTLAECQAKVAEKRALAISDPAHRRKHLLAAESWAFLASKLEKPKE
jgi:hypothetical protein